MTEEEARGSRLTTFAYTMAIVGVVVALGGIVAVQLGLIAPLGAFAMFVLGTLLCGTLALLAGIVSVVRTRRGFRHEDRRRSITATAVGAALVALVLVASAGGQGKPPINDISTDLEDPPQFASADAVPAYAGRDMSYPDEFVPIVRSAYPEVDPIVLSAPPDDAYARALASARSLGWEVVHEDPDRGTFTATDTSAIFRFVDDVVVRVQPEDDGARIDVRSKSRDGRGDLGANAERIQRFAAELKLPPVATR
jgi:uncharacterized protein (DUF1499 family)